jgi:hypothetical protein
LNFWLSFRHANLIALSLLTGTNQACEIATVLFLRAIAQSQWPLAIISELQKLARSHTPAALATLVEIMCNTASPPNARVSAAIALLDRGYGRPSTAVFVEMTPQTSSADPEALLITVVAAMDEMAANAKAAEKRAIEAEQRV